MLKYILDLLTKYKILIVCSFLCLMLTTFCYKMYELYYNEQKDELNHLMIEAKNLLQARMQSYSYALLGLAGVYRITNFNPKIDEIVKYEEQRQLYHNFEGSLGFGFIRYVKNDLDSYEKMVLKKIKNFKVKAVPGHGLNVFEDHMIIEWIGPLERNKPALGLDIGSEPRRRSAALKSAREGNFHITSNIQLVQNNSKEPGFLLNLPMYKSTKVPLTEKERLETLVGWTYSPLLVSQIFDIFDRELNKKLALTVTEIHEHSNSKDTLFEFHQDLKKYNFNSEFILDIFGSKWSLKGHLIKTLSDDYYERNLFFFFLFGNLAIIALSIFYARHESNGIKINEIERNLDLKSALLNGSNLSIVSTDLEGGITTFNTGASTLFEFSANEVVGKKNIISFYSPEVFDQYEQADTKATQKTYYTNFEMITQSAKIYGKDLKEWNFISKRKKIVSLRVNVTLIYNEDKKHIGYLFIGENLGEIKKIQNELLDQSNILDNTVIHFEIPKLKTK